MPKNIIAASIRLHYARIDSEARTEAQRLELLRIRREIFWSDVNAGLHSLEAGL